VSSPVRFEGFPAIDITTIRLPNQGNGLSIGTFAKAKENKKYHCWDLKEGHS